MIYILTTSMLIFAAVCVCLGVDKIKHYGEDDYSL